ncbi:MAG: hypothetical protein KA821_08565 [Chitinophagaceae bacterium]|nr:hypothetical protein [Chitinophagaceae bacterium]
MRNDKKKTKPGLDDSADDRKHFKPDESALDLPEVRDIPGQEHVHVPPLGELADTTLSSDDEEGKRVFDSDDTEYREADVSAAEKKALRDAAEKTPGVKDDQNLQNARLDDRDADGELLNERTGLSGRDLDVPGSEEDDADEDIGEEDEENNSYSLDNEDEDDSISRQ